MAPGISLAGAFSKANPSKKVAQQMTLRLESQNPCMTSSEVIKKTRSAKIALFLFLATSICAATASFVQAQEQKGWGSIWQQRMTIGQAQLDEAYKLAEGGKSTEALAQIDSVIAANPRNWRAHFLKAAVLILVKRQNDAVQQIDISIDLARKANVSAELLAQMYGSKSRTCVDVGRYDDAKRALEAANHLQPSDPTTLNDLAWLLATSPNGRVRNGRRAVGFAQKSCALTNWGNAFSIDTLAAAYAAAGDFSQAVKFQQRAIDALDPKDRAIQLPGMRSRLELYSSRHAYVSS
jgi:tetratricopeptide (TPR) repeat protein